MNVKIICSELLSRRILVTCNICQNEFKTFNTREVRRSACCLSIEKLHRRGIFKKSANICKIKRRKKLYNK